jgi:EAL domain-containing protein (putative c-di-GMP-specific phosphodiesterase class I)
MRKLVNEAFEKDLFEVHVQEIHKNGTVKQGEPRKFECLVRMYDSDKKDNLISPARFLPVVKKD